MSPKSLITLLSLVLIDPGSSLSHVAFTPRLYKANVLPSGENLRHLQYVHYFYVLFLFHVERRQE